MNLYFNSTQIFQSQDMTIWVATEGRVRGLDLGFGNIVCNGDGRS